MQEQEDPSASIDEDAEEVAALRRRWRWVLAAFLIALAVILGAFWLSREKIADTLIADQLEKLGLPATYEIESISADRQVLRKIAVGDPARPDLTIERVVVATRTGWGMPGIGRITLQKPRIYGSYRNGKLSFGALDPLIFKDSKQPAGLPELDLAVVDGRGLLESDFGNLGLKLEGQGPLRSGFQGTVAAVAPDVQLGGCRLSGVSVYGTLQTASGKPQFKGPVRSSGVKCPGQAMALASANAVLDLMLDPQFNGAEGSANLKLKQLGIAKNNVAVVDAATRYVWRDGRVTVHFNTKGGRLATPYFAATTLGLDGALRADQRFASASIEGEFDGSGIQPAPGLDTSLAGAQTSAAGTLAAPLLAQFRRSLASEVLNSSLAGQFTLRKNGDALNLLIPQGRFAGRSGQSLLAVSKVQVSSEAGKTPRIAGNFVTGGAGMPRLSGRLERQGNGRIVSRLSMAPYAAGDASMALPMLSVTQAPGGAYGFAGLARISGPLPGGEARNLEMPISGSWRSGTGLAMWQECVTARFDRLALANLTLDRQRLSLCPARGRAIVQAGSGGLKIAAGAPALALQGKFGSTAIRLRSGAIGFAMPGQLSAKTVDVAFGDPKTETRFKLSNVTASLGQKISGTFSGSEFRLAAVPLDLLEASGEWRFDPGKLTIERGLFRLEDRELADRFKPMTARDATLTLSDGKIVASAMLRETVSDREIVRADILHDLRSGIGNADLALADVRFDRQLQPFMLSDLVLGVVENAVGTVTGGGRIDWTAKAVTSTGQFSTAALDFAAPFGPTKGVSGTVEFTDLLGLITAPDQRLKIRSINPGIEALNGELSFTMLPDRVLMINGAQWPFLDGAMRLLPTRMKLGAAEVRRYVLEVEGVSAARFVEKMEFGNISASGIFDGKLPLVFENDVGRIDGGTLISRAPGGNVSYVGDLTYLDLSSMANFAFDALRSLSYRRMEITLEGELDGEIITRLAFDQIKQGEGAKRNFITGQLARLPIKMNVNVKAPFFALVSSFKRLYDPASFSGTVTATGQAGTAVAPAKPTPRKVIQASESEGVP